jgi:hypothetical protein
MKEVIIAFLIALVVGAFHQRVRGQRLGANV